MGIVKCAVPFAVALTAVLLGVVCAVVPSTVLMLGVALIGMAFLSMSCPVVAVGVLMALLALHNVFFDLTVAWFDTTAALPLEQRVTGPVAREVPIFFPVVLLLATWHLVASLFAHQNGKALTAPGFLPAILLTTYAAIGLLWSPNPNWSIVTLGMLGANLLAFRFFVVTVKHYGLLRRMLWLYAALGVIHVAFILASFVIQHSDYFYTKVIAINCDGTLDLVLRLPVGLYNSEGGLRMREFFAEYHTTGLILNTHLAAIAALLVVQRDKLRSLALGGGFVVVSFVSLSTNTRGPFMGLAAMLVCAVLLVPRLRRRALLLGAILSVLVAVQIVAVTRAQNMLAGVEKDSRLVPAVQASEGKTPEFVDSFIPESRRFIWEEAFRLILESRGWGVGAGNFTLHTGPVLGLYSCHPHSLYNSFLVDFGWSGFAFLVYIGYVWYSAWKSASVRRESDRHAVAMVLLAGLVGVGVSSLVDYDYTFPVIWCYAGLTYAAMRVAATEEPDSQATGEGLDPVENGG